MSKTEVKISDVAKASGFSTATVSRVLNNDPKFSVGDETRKKIFKVAEELGYRKKIVLPIIDNISLLYWIGEKEELEDVYYKEMRIALEKHALDNNMQLKIISKKDGISKVPKSTEAYIGLGLFSDEELKYLDKVTPNGVFIDTNPDTNKYDCVGTDLKGTIINAYEDFIGRGHENIAFLGGTFVNPNTKRNEMDLREEAFREIMLEHGKNHEEYIYTKQGFSVETGYVVMTQLLSKQNTLPTAIITAADPIAIGALQAINENGINVPEDIEIIGINNVNVSKYVAPPLTTYEIHVDLIAENAIKLVIERVIDQRTVPKNVCFRSTLVKRKSTKLF